MGSEFKPKPFSWEERQIVYSDDPPTGCVYIDDLDFIGKYFPTFSNTPAAQSYKKSSVAVVITHALMAEIHEKRLSAPLLYANILKLLGKSELQGLSLPQCLKLCESGIEFLYPEEEFNEKEGATNNLLEIFEKKETEQKNRIGMPDVNVVKVFEDIKLLNEELKKQKKSPAPTKFEIIKKGLEDVKAMGSDIVKQSLGDVKVKMANQSLNDGTVTVKMNSGESIIITGCENEGLVYDVTKLISEEELNANAEEACLTDDPDIVIFQDFSFKNTTAPSKAALVVEILTMPKAKTKKPVMVGMRFGDSLHCVLIIDHNPEKEELYAKRWEKEKDGLFVSITFADFNRYAIEAYFFDIDKGPFRNQKSLIEGEELAEIYYDSVIIQAPENLKWDFRCGNLSGLPHLILNSEWEAKQLEVMNNNTTTKTVDVKVGLTTSAQAGASASQNLGETIKTVFQPNGEESKIDSSRQKTSRHNARNSHPSDFETWGLKITNEGPNSFHPKLTGILFHVLMEKLVEKPVKKSLEESVEGSMEESMEKSVKKLVERLLKKEIIQFKFKAKNFWFRIWRKLFPSQNNERTISTEIFEKSDHASVLEKIAITTGGDDHEYEMSKMLRFKFTQWPEVPGAKGFLCVLKFDLDHGKILYCGLLRALAEDYEKFFVENFESCL